MVHVNEVEDQRVEAQGELLRPPLVEVVDYNSTSMTIRHLPIRQDRLHDRRDIDHPAYNSLSHRNHDNGISDGLQQLEQLVVVVQQQHFEQPELDRWLQEQQQDRQPVQQQVDV